MPVVHNDGADFAIGARSADLDWPPSFLLQLAGCNMLIDPVMSASLGGVVPRLSLRVKLVGVTEEN